MIAEFTAYGKLNLLLDVLGKREDGFHDMAMIMQTVDLTDEITLTLNEESGFRCTCSVASVPMDSENLALKGAGLFFEAAGKEPEGLQIHIEKRIPMGGGMAGGSADAAAVLHGLNTCYGYPLSRERLMELGARLGSDVPYCLTGGTALAEGRGERLTELPPMPECTYLLICPNFSSPTGALFAELDRETEPFHPQLQKATEALFAGDLAGFSGLCANCFQPILARKYPVIDRCCSALLSGGALGASMTGTGSVVFGIFPDDSCAQKCADGLELPDCRIFLAHNV